MGMRLFSAFHVFFKKYLPIPRLQIYSSMFKILTFRGTWVAQSVKHLILAQVVISQSVGLNPSLGSVLTAQSPEPALDSVFPSLSLPLALLVCALSLSLSLFQK